MQTTRSPPRDHVLAVERSAKAIAHRIGSCADRRGPLTPLRVAAGALELESNEKGYDVAFAVRVGAFDGRDPHAGAEALRRLSRMGIAGGSILR